MRAGTDRFQSADPAFTEETGRSPGRFLQNTRIENAKLLLQNREYSMEIIANMVGYSNANYFCKVFRRETGESPGAYRMQHLAPPKLDEEKRRQMERLEEVDRQKRSLSA